MSVIHKNIVYLFESQYFYSLFNISAQGPLSKYEKL